MTLGARNLELGSLQDSPSWQGAKPIWLVELPKYLQLFIQNKMHGITRAWTNCYRTSILCYIRNFQLLLNAF